MGWNPLYHGLLKVGEGKREGVVSFYAGERRVDLHGAGFRLNEEVLSLFYPEVSVLAWEEWEDPFLLSFL